MNKAPMDNMYIWIAVILFGLILLFIILGIVLSNKRKKTLLDDMEGHDFEYYCASLLEKRGFMEVEVTKGSGDFGADILAQKDGITYAIQCKAYSTPVGVKAIQEAYFGKAYYDCMVGAVLTNQYFTKSAVEAAKKVNILLWDRGYLDVMIEEENTE